MTMTPDGVPNWERIQRELLAEAAGEIDRAMAVAVLLERGHSQKEIRDRLGVGQDEQSIKMLRRIAPALEREELPEEFEL